MKWFRCLVVLLALLATQIVGVASAYAASVYDQTVQTVGQLRVTSNDATYSEDVTNSYSAYFYNECDNPGTIASYENALSTGVRTVSVARSGTREYVLVFWSSQSSGSATFYNNGDGTHRLSVNHVSGYFTLDMYGSNDVLVTCNHTTGNYGQFAISDDQSVVLGNNFASWVKVFLSTYAINYPAGYEGATVPAPTSYVGTVDCIDPAKQPAYMYITQAGNNGYATLTYSSPGVADWSYDLTSDPYQITVGCGDVLAASSVSVDPATTSEVWVCDIYSNPAECQTS